MKTVITAFFSLIVFSLYAQSDWQALSDELITDQSGNGFGYDLAFSADGSTLVVGAPFHQVGSDRPGAVYAYRKVPGGNIWQQWGSLLTGNEDSDRMGYSVAINNEGTVLAAGLPFFDNPAGEWGKVRVFHWQNGDWEQKGSDIETSGGFEFGWEVSLDAPGDRLAVTSIAGGADVVYEWTGTDWQLMGAPFTESGDFNPFSAALSGNGQRVAFGSPNKSGLVVDEPGSVYVYEWSGSQWTVLGEPMLDVLTYRDYGIAVDLNYLGNTVVIGAPKQRDENNSQRGGVEVHEYAPGLGWMQKGSTLYGTNQNDEFGTDVRISWDGNIIFVGAPKHDNNGNLNNGSGETFQWNGTDWEPRGTLLGGSEFNTEAGKTLAMDANGLLAAITSDDEKVQIYNWSTVSSTLEPLALEWKLFPNPVNEWLNVELPTEAGEAEVLLVDLLGRVISQQFSQGEAQLRFDVSGLGGTHWVVVRNAGGVAAQPVVVD